MSKIVGLATSLTSTLYIYQTLFSPVFSLYAYKVNFHKTVLSTVEILLT